MIKDGKGGAHTQTGLDFESRINFREAFNRLPGYEVRQNDLLFKGKLVARMYKKGEIYSKLLNPYGLKFRLSRRLFPDEGIFIEKTRTFFIIEMKYQHGSGSVDEKLQTCDFKKKQYEKMFSGTGIKVEYVYILNDWYRQPGYKDVLDYVVSVGCRYFFEELPFKFLGIPEPEGEKYG